MTSPRILLRDALCAIIIAKGLVPTTTIANAGGTAIGATSFTAASANDAARFQAGGLAYFADGTGELPAIVDHVTGSDVFLSFQGRFVGTTPITGLLFPHAQGAVVASNVIPVRPNTGAQDAAIAMLANRFPVFRVFVWGSVTKWSETHAVQPTMAAHVIYQLPIDQPPGPQLDADLWLLQQENRAEADLDTLIRSLLQNYTLTVNGSSNAEFVDQAMQAAVENTSNAQMPLYEQYLDLVILGDIRDIDDLN